MTYKTQFPKPAWMESHIAHYQGKNFKRILQEKEVMNPSMKEQVSNYNNLRKSLKRITNKQIPRSF